MDVIPATAGKRVYELCRRSRAERGCDLQFSAWVEMPNGGTKLAQLRREGVRQIEYTKVAFD